LFNKIVKYSEYILGKLVFKWPVSVDGNGFKAGRHRCASVIIVTNKPNDQCSVYRDHGIVKYWATSVVKQKTGALEIGK